MTDSTNMGISADVPKVNAAEMLKRLHYDHPALVLANMLYGEAGEKVRRFYDSLHPDTRIQHPDGGDYSEGPRVAWLRALVFQLANGLAQAEQHLPAAPEEREGGERTYTRETIAGHVATWLKDAIDALRVTAGRAAAEENEKKRRMFAALGVNPDEIEGIKFD